MRAVGIRRHTPWAKLICLLIIAAAVVFGIYVHDRWAAAPSTDDATIDADVVHVAAVVGGRIIGIPISENSEVKEGDILFEIDPIPCQLAVQQAQSDLDLAQAALETQRHVLSTQRSAATVAADQVRRATTNLDLAMRTADRLSMGRGGMTAVERVGDGEFSSSARSTSG